MLRPRHRQGAVDVDGRRDVDRRRHSAGALDAQTDDASAVGPGGGIGGRAHTSQEQSRGRSRASGQRPVRPCRRRSGRPHHPRRCGRGTAAPRRPGAPRSAPRSPAIAIWPRWLTACGRSPSRRAGGRRASQARFTRTSWPRTSTSAPRVTEAGTGRPSATSTATWSAIRSARVRACHTWKRGTVPTARSPARHAANTSSTAACPRAFTGAPRVPTTRSAARSRARCWAPGG